MLKTKVVAVSETLKRHGILLETLPDDIYIVKGALGVPSSLFPMVSNFVAGRVLPAYFRDGE